jgi:hypothetical protein
MGKYKLGKCWSCWYDGSSRKKNAKCRISRHQKKRLKVFLQSPVWQRMQFNIEECNCNLRLLYELSRRHFNLFKKYYDQIALLNSEYLQTDQCLAPVYIDCNGRLSWGWESDDDYGGSSGVMPFCYTKEEAGKTWAFSEVGDLFWYLYRATIKGIPPSVTSDITLLQFLKDNPIPQDWDEEE